MHNEFDVFRFADSDWKLDHWTSHIYSSWTTGKNLPGSANSNNSGSASGNNSDSDGEHRALKKGKMVAHAKPRQALKATVVIADPLCVHA